MQNAIKCEECGALSQRVRLCEPFDSSEGAPMLLCPECWNDYYQAKLDEQNTHERDDRLPAE